MTGVLWSGGKDSFLALLLHAQASKQPFSSYCLVTFVPPQGVFLCHPLGLLEQQAACLGALHILIAIDLEAWQDDYARAFRYLRRVHRIREVLTGDSFFSLPAEDSYWLGSLLKDNHIQLSLPLHETSGAEDCLDSAERFGIGAVVSGVQQEWNRPGFLGSRLSLNMLAATGLYDEDGFNLLGEQGEYHTSVTSFNGVAMARAGEVVPFCHDGMRRLHWEPHWLQPSGKRLNLRIAGQEPQEESDSFRLRHCARLHRSE